MTTDLLSEVGGMPLGWWLALPPVLVIVFIACAARLTQGGWLAPGAAWAGFWACATGLPLIFAAKYPVSSSALWVIAGFVIAIYAGSQIGQQHGADRPHAPPRPVKQNRLMRPLCWIGCGAGFLMTGLTLVKYQASWSVWTSPARLGELANTISVDRYAGEANESVLIRFCFVFCYLGSLAGGHAMVWRGDRRFAWWSVGPLLGALSYTILTTAKAGLLISVLLWLAANATERMRRVGRTWLVSWKLVWLGGTSVGLVVLLFLSAMLLRYGSDHADDREFLVERLRNYSVSHLTAFSSWWDSGNRDAESLGWGRQSLFGPAALLGLSSRQQGNYEVIVTERYQIDSNLFTLYRSLIADLTLPGALLGLALTGYIAGRCYRNILHGRRSAGAAVFLTAYFVLLGWSHIVNALGYTTLVLAFGLYALAAGAFKPACRPTHPDTFHE